MAVSTIPDGLELVIDFVNTRDGDWEQLARPEALADWLRDRGDALALPASAPVGTSELAAALALREALRSTMYSHNGGPPAPIAAAELEAVARRGALSIGFGGDGGARVLPRASGFDGVLAALLVPVARATADGSWQRVKACGAEACRWAFYDRSRNRSGRWCDMASCGNREKVRAYRARRGA